MTNQHDLEAVSRTFTDLIRFTQAFGRNVFLFPGDFRRFMPIVKAGSQSRNVNVCFEWSVLSLLFKTLYLKQNTRLQALRNNENADPDTLQFRLYLRITGETQLQVEQKEAVTLQPSVKFFIDISFVSNQVLLIFARTTRTLDGWEIMLLAQFETFNSSSHPKSRKCECCWKSGFPKR